MPNVGPMELVIVLAIALIVLGPKRLPEAGKSAGRGLREFKNAISGTTSEEPEDTAELAAPARDDIEPAPARDAAPPTTVA